MKFDFIIGNPPYQEEAVGSDNKTFMPPIYDKFMDSTFEIADKVELIHPARFLFNAGQTPKAWNEKMLSDPHFKVLHYEPDASKVFANTEIKGGIAITYHDNNANFGAIEVFTKYIGVGAFDTRTEATNLEKYFHTKFLRTLLGILKITQHNEIGTWRMIPLQDFTAASDIDWSKSIPEIDKQLYAKYGLDEKEIAFIESHVKEMA